MSDMKQTASTSEKVGAFFLGLALATLFIIATTICMEFMKIDAFVKQHHGEFSTPAPSDSFPLL